MNKIISHNRHDETPEAKARWFQSLSLTERMDMLCYFTELILENNPRIAELKNAKLPSGSFRLLTKTQS